MSKWFKYGSLVLSGVSMAVGIASDYVGRKNIVNDILKSKEFEEQIAKKAAEILKNSKGA